MSEHRQRRRFGAELWLPLSVYLVYGLVHVFLGRIHLDEGAYLFAAREVLRGKVLYRDFFFLQPPVSAYVYALVRALCGGSLLAAKCASLLFGLGALAAALAVARRLGGTTASWVAGGLIALNGFQVYFFTVIRLYALTACLLMGALWLIAGRRPGPWRWMGAFALVALCVGTRLTALPALAVLGLALLVREYRRPSCIVAGALAAGAVLAAVFLPFVFLAREQLLFNILGLNLSLYGHSPLTALLTKAGAAREVAGRYLVLLGLAAALLVAGALGLFEERRQGASWGEIVRLRLAEERPFWTAVCWLIFGAVFLGHFLARYCQPSYQAFIMPLGAVAVGISGAAVYDRLADQQLRRVLAVMFATACVLTALAYGRTSLSLKPGGPPLFQLAEQARFVREHVPADRPLLSADTALLAAEADRDLLRGSAGSDYFPEWDTKRCNTYGVLNDEVFLAYVRQQRAGAVVLNSRAFTLALPSLLPVEESRRQALFGELERYYAPARSFPSLLIEGETTTVYLPRPPAEPAGR